MNCVVIGYGFAGKSFHSYLISHPSNDLVLYGICVRQESYKAQILSDFGSKAPHVFVDFESVLKDENVNVVVVATPSSTHFELSLRALKAKKNVVCDKPMCTSEIEADALLSAAKENGVFFTVFQNRRLDGDFLTIKKLLKENKLGEKLNWIEMSWQKFGATSKAWKNVGMEEGGGRFWDLGIHIMDQLLQFIPCGIKSVYCRVQKDYPNNPDYESYAMVMVTFENGSTAVIDVSTLALIEKPRFLLYGSEGSYIKYGVDPQEAAMIKGQIESAQEPEDLYGTLKTLSGEEKIKTENGNWLYYYKNIQNHIQNKEELLVSMESAHRVMKLMHCALKSAETNQVIQLNIPSLDSYLK